jgi:hypothetical protein
MVGDMIFIRNKIKIYFNIMGSWSFPGVKWSGCGINHPPPSRPRLKKEHSSISTPVPSRQVTG